MRGLLLVIAACRPAGGEEEEGTKGRLNKGRLNELSLGCMLAGVGGGRGTNSTRLNQCT